MFDFLKPIKGPPPAWARYYSEYAREKAKLGAIPAKNELVELGQRAVLNGKALEGLALFIDAGHLALTEQTLADFLTRGGKVPGRMREPYVNAIYRMKRRQHSA